MVFPHRLMRPSRPRPLSGAPRRADPCESVGKSAEQSAIAEARVRGRVIKTHPNDQKGSRMTRFFF